MGDALAQTVRVVIWAGSVMSRREVQTSTANSTGTIRDTLEAWARKDVESVPTKMNVLSSGMVLVTPSLVTLWKNMMWLSFGFSP